MLGQKLAFAEQEAEEKRRERLRLEELNEKLLVGLQSQETPSKYKLALESQRHQESLRVSQLERELALKTQALERRAEDLQHELQLKEH